MWTRNLVFGAVCLLGMGALTAGLLRSDRIQDPVGFQPQRYGQESYRTVIDQVNLEFQESWEQQGIGPALRADDRTLVRRLSLGLTGTIPSFEELRRLEQLPESERLEWWLSHLLQDRRCSDYLAERLARAYVGTQNGPFLVYRRRRFVTWLSYQLLENRPYDQLVRQLIAETGLWTDSPAVNFVTVTLDENGDGKPDPIRLAGRTSRAFLGMRIDCLQCHDDMLGNVQLGTEDEPRTGEQRDFHTLASFFGQTLQSFFGIDDGEGEYEYKYLHAEEEEVVSPEPPFGDQWLGDGKSRRVALADWVTHPNNDAFARAIVNRIWAVMVGRPLVEPIDDIPLFGEYPPGLETLADDFVRNGYDLQRLIRIIAALTPYQVESRADFEITPRHETSLAVFPLTRLRPEQVAGAVTQAASLSTIDANSHIVWQLRQFFEQNEFINRYGDMGEDEFESRAGTISQRLLMMNGELVKERTKVDLVSNAATRIALLAPSNDKAIETAYLAILTRAPGPAELEYFRGKLDEPDANRQEALEDLCWVLINSTEFSWNH